ncbi:hypothetical protein [Actinospongicola halichondriae]|uniref:hypothetical protein n=1 Tax=Actinospongicola halichondriae TaxID=3236844 RepID=UPI003D4EEE9D
MTDPVDPVANEAPVRVHLRRFGIAYGVLAAWVVAAAVFPSRPVEEVALAGDGAPNAVELAGPEADGSSTTVDQTVVGPDGSTATIAESGGGPAPVDGSGGPDTTAAGPAGVSRAGVQCGPGVHQVPGNSYSAPCTPAFSGDNGGATAKGVSGDTIRIVRRRYPDSANSQAVDAVVAQAGGADHSVVRQVRQTFIDHFDETYELYGRRIEWIEYESEFGDSTLETQGRGREGACLDAEVVAEELNAFAVVGEKSALSKPFTECAAQRGVMVLDGASYASETFNRKYDPYVWAIIMECERINYQVYEYFEKRLAFKPAKYAGSDELRAKDRKFGTYTPVGDGGDTACADIGKAEAKRTGVDAGSTYNYTLDVSRFPDEAARGIIQFKRDGVTSVVLACDAISAIFLTQSATSQNYHPEWLVIGIALTDIDNAARLYDQDQVDGHLFGMSQLGATPKLLGPTGEPGKLYQAITGRQIPAGTSGQFHNVSFVYNFIQAAGPNLTPATVAAGARALPPLGAPDFSLGYWSFQDAPDGTPGGGDHAAIDDSREIYWIANGRSPADGEAGTYVETYGGRRFRNGEWPAEDPPVYPGR